MPCVLDLFFLSYGTDVCPSSHTSKSRDSALESQWTFHTVLLSTLANRVSDWIWVFLQSETSLQFTHIFFVKFMASKNALLQPRSSTDCVFYFSRMDPEITMIRAASEWWMNSRFTNSFHFMLFSRLRWQCDSYHYFCCVFFFSI